MTSLVRLARYRELRRIVNHDYRVGLPSQTVDVKLGELLTSLLVELRETILELELVEREHS